MGSQNAGPLSATELLKNRILNQVQGRLESYFARLMDDLRGEMNKVHVAWGEAFTEMEENKTKMQEVTDRKNRLEKDLHQSMVVARQHTECVEELQQKIERRNRLLADQRTALMKEVLGLRDELRRISNDPIYDEFQFFDEEKFDLDNIDPDPHAEKKRKKPKAKKNLQVLVDELEQEVTILTEQLDRAKKGAEYQIQEIERLRATAKDESMRADMERRSLEGTILGLTQEREKQLQENLAVLEDLKSQHSAATLEFEEKEAALQAELNEACNLI